VESGLDIPRANTIFIDEADGYGLADLHQRHARPRDPRRGQPPGHAAERPHRHRGQ
jgi:hypothetical protein